MVLVGYLASNKLANSKGIETFRDRLMFDNSNKINYNEYYNSVVNSTLGYICICIFILMNVIPALLIAYNCNKNFRDSILMNITNIGNTKFNATFFKVFNQF